MNSAQHRQLERYRREELRWQILVTLNVGGRLSPMSEDMILRVLSDAEAPTGPHELRTELDYLAEKGLVRITSREAHWRVELTAAGTDVVEYTVDAPPGIARPR